MNNQHILVTGGAGYIGSNFVNHLRSKTGYLIEVVDNFSQGKNNLIKDEKVHYSEVDLRDKTKLLKLFKEFLPNVVVHFAALASVPDSVVRPYEYYENNVLGGLNLLEGMRAVGTDKIIFSSSASVYGEPESEEIKEDHPKNPTNPYGRTKLIFEKILQDYHRAYGMNSISFRYFCAAGVNNSLKTGEYHNPESHVIPCIIQTLLGEREMFHIYGNDYSTPDGTGIRDYIHIDDLAAAHIKAMEKLIIGEKICAEFNLGINKGFSVMELIKTAEKISGQKLNFDIRPRRSGDPSRLIADSFKAQKELGWTPQFTQIEDIIETSYNFFKKKKL